MGKHAYTIYHHTYSIIVFFLICITTACSKETNRAEINRLNDSAYSYHYRNLDSTFFYASKALSLSSSYPDGRAEALNNLAFVHIAKMNYVKAETLLKEVLNRTDNQLELLVADVQLMRLSQRKSDNKNFYHYTQQAEGCMKRLLEDKNLLDVRQQRRLVYAQSEYYIVFSAYLYYVGQIQKSSDVLSQIDPVGAIVKDTAQLLAYYYNVGAGGVINANSYDDLMQSEFDNLMRCYLLSRQYHYDFWEANSMQAISEHLLQKGDRQKLIGNNMQEFDYLNVSLMPDSLLAGNLAQRALGKFKQYGDVYQTAGTWRTLSEAYRSISDFQSALVCLENALKNDTAINSAPDLVASIREQLSIVYAAIDNKVQSDYNRNIYLDLQDYTRQDRFLEARAEQLDTSLRQLDMMIVAVVILIFLIVAMLVYLGYWRHKHNDLPSIEELRSPLNKWNEKRSIKVDDINEKIEETKEEIRVYNNKLYRFRKYNIEQRAKVWLASTVTPLISRLLYEIKAFRTIHKPEEQTACIDYIMQLLDSIDVCNQQLTHWIQLKQGDFLLRIESFPLNQLFEIIKQNTMSFRLHNIKLDIKSTNSVVKADRVLTLFMINTMVENARRYTSSGGTVSVFSTDNDNYVEISIEDNGRGMTEDQIRTVFKHKLTNEIQDSYVEEEHRHGFGLINCKGIIDKYRKLSAIFNVCKIGVESKMGFGSRFYFRLPKGIVRIIILGMMLTNGLPLFANLPKQLSYTKARACAFADSAYYSNINGNYTHTISFADSCLSYLNKTYSLICSSRHINARLLRLSGDYPAKAAELEWLRDSIKIDFSIILDIRNETAVAALALHDWNLYNYNNAVYTQLFREVSADNSLSSYVYNMQRANNNRNIAIIMLVALLIGIFPAYYILYYRQRMNLHLYIDKFNSINKVLCDNSLNSKRKLDIIKNIWTSNVFGFNKKETHKYKGECPKLFMSLINEICLDLETDATIMLNLSDKHNFIKDELRRVILDCDRVYISCNVLDNCLSSLKHETMYYPSRIKQLIATNPSFVGDDIVVELAEYYKTLYTTLISNAVKILNDSGSLATPNTSIDLLYSILCKKNKGIKPKIFERKVLAKYIDIDIVLESVIGILPTDLFSSNTQDVDFLVCCQIMRDMGEATGARGCGISARCENNMLVVTLRMPIDVWYSVSSQF